MLMDQHSLLPTYIPTICIVWSAKPSLHLQERQATEPLVIYRVNKRPPNSGCLLTSSLFVKHFIFFRAVQFLDAEERVQHGSKEKSRRHVGMKDEEGDDILAHLTEGETFCVLLSLQITLSTQQIKSNIFHSAKYSPQCSSFHLFLYRYNDRF